MGDASTDLPLEEGRLVVVPQKAHLGVGRLTAWVDDAQRHAQVFFYDGGELLQLSAEELAPCPPGVWDKTPTSSGA